MSSFRLLNDDTPADAFTTRVPVSVPGTGVPALVPTAIVMFEVNEVTLLSSESTAATLIVGVRLEPDFCVTAGWTVKARATAGPAVMLKVVLDAPVRPVELAFSTYPLPVLSMLTVENVATPATAPTVVVPRSVAPLVPVPDLIASVTLPTNVGTGFPAASCAVIWIAGANGTPATVFFGCTVTASFDARPTRMSNGALCALDNPLELAINV